MRVEAPILKLTETCHVSRVMCCVLHITCHLSLTSTATATDPPPANLPIMHSRLVRKDPRTQKLFKTQKIIETSKNQKCLDARQY